MALVLLGGPIGTGADQYTDQIAGDQAKEAQNNARIASLKAEIAAAQSQEPQLQAIIIGLNTQIAATQAQLATAQAQYQQITASLVATQERLAAEQQQLSSDKAQLSRQLVVMYEMQQQSTPLNNMLASGNFNGFFRTLVDTQRIGNLEMQTVSLVTQTEAAVHSDLSVKAQQQSDRKAVVAALAATQNQLSEQRAAQQSALADLQALQARDQQLAVEAQEANNSLNGQIANLQQQEQAALAAGGGHGDFTWPEHAPISQGFGCTQYTAEPYDPSCPYPHRFHNGIDLAGPPGTPIAAADAGIAQTYKEAWVGGSCQEESPSFTGGFCGFGYNVIIDHGNGWYTLYGHLSGFAIANGHTVSRGQTIAYEGSTGNSSGPHLHFGIQHNGVWVDPLQYLSS